MAMARCASGIGAGVSGRMHTTFLVQHPPVAARRLMQASLVFGRPSQSAWQMQQPALQTQSQQQQRWQRLLTRAEGSSGESSGSKQQAGAEEAADAQRVPTGDAASETGRASTSGSDAAADSTTNAAIGNSSSSSTANAEEATDATASSSTELQQEPMLSPRAAGTGFAVLAVVHGVAGAGLALLAPTVAASALNVGWPGGQVLAVTLLGCYAASLLRSASLCWFLKEGADEDELHTWRYQRANIALLLASFIAAATQLLGWRAAAPPLLAGVFAIAAATAAVSGSVALAANRHGIVFATGLECISSMKERLKVAGVYLLRDVCTLAGVLLTFLTCISAWAASQLVTSPAAVGADVALAAVLVGHTLPIPAVAYLQRLLAAGLVVLGAQCLVLLENAHRLQNVSLDVATKLAILGALEAEQQERFGVQGPARVAPPARFTVLHAGLFASLAVQAYFLLQAGSLGVNVSSDAALWGVQFWSVMVGALYGLVALTVFDWYALTNAVLSLASSFGGVVAMTTRALYYDFYWSQVQRK